MASTKLTKFLGTAPKSSPELVQDSVAQSAVNTKLYSGDLIPYRNPADIENVKRTGEIQTIYPMRDPSDPTVNKWLSWLTDVDVAVTTTINDEEQRIYYTGDGAPKVTNYDLAIQGNGPYPVSSYDLGLPLPTAVPSASASSFSNKTTSTIARDSGNLATIVTTAAHGLRTGNYVSISGFTDLTGTASASLNDPTVTVTITGHKLAVGGIVNLQFDSNDIVDGSYKITSVATNTFTVEIGTAGAAVTNTPTRLDMSSYNVSSVPVTVEDDTTFTIFSSGFEQATYSSGDGTVSLSGTEVARTYVYTWVTPWGEESVPSEPSELINVREGQTVTVSNLPNSKPAGNNFISGIRLYRTVTSTSGTSYLRLKTIWFPLTAVEASRTSNVATLKVSGHHNLLVGDKIKISGIAFGGVADTSFDVTDSTSGSVTEIVDDETFKYTSVGSDKATTATTAGTLYWDVSEVDSDDSRYYESTTFTDDYPLSLLTDQLDTLDADAPDADMIGLTVAQNNILVGFVGNELCFSEPDRPWAWPIRYRLVFDSQIKGIATSSGNIVVLTDKYPYVVYGSTPANMTANRIDTIMPCVSKRGIVSMDFGIAYPTYGGLALYSPSGTTVITKYIHDWDTWTDAYDPTTIIGTYYQGKYFGSHSAGSFIFEYDEKVGGYFVTTPIRYYSAYYDTEYDRLYYITNTNGLLREWDADGQPFLPMEWKSKVFVSADYKNLGAARIVGDYEDISEEADAIIAYNAGVPAYNLSIWLTDPTNPASTPLVAQLGTLNGPVDYVDPETSAQINVYGTLNSLTLNGDSLTRDLLSTDNIGFVGFKLWANKKLILDATINDSEIFRLPRGYKSDTFEVAVSGTIRIRAIHFGETPYGLRAV